MNHSISMSQEQCACILANAFFCTFPDRCYNENPASLPYINFNGLYGRSKHEKGSNSNVEKLKCILHYFQRVTNESRKMKIKQDLEWNN